MNVVPVQASFIILIVTAYVGTATGHTRLGLHVTQEELSVWRHRARSGPYHSKGDVSQNSPGDWIRIVGNAKAFLSKPSSERWVGQTTATCRTNASSQPNRTKGEKIRDAAFVYLIHGTSSYRDAVRGELLAQAATTGTKFADLSRWCVNGSVSEQSLLDVAPWIARLLFAYDWIRSSLSTMDRTTLDAWFQAAGRHFESMVHKTASKRWPNRKANIYGSSPSRRAGTPAYNIYYGGPIQDNWHLGWDNISATVVRTFGLIGIQRNDATLKSEAKRWFKEWLKYNVWYTNTGNQATHGEYHRCCWTGLTHFPNLGWGYTSATIGAMTTLAAAFHRAGDSDLFTYSTSEGYYGTQGGPKSLEAVIMTHFKMMDHTIIRYGTNHASDVGKPHFIQDNIYEPTTWHHIGDVWIAPIANHFYRNSYFKSMYKRTASGVFAYPSVPASTGISAWSGEQGVFPGVLFMFGETEGILPGTPAPFSAPSNLMIQLR